MPFIFRRSNSYNLNDDNVCHFKARLQVGTDYVPAYEIIDHEPSSTKYKELFFIRISQQGLIISHKPSVNLGHLGSLGRDNKLLPPSKRALYRKDTLRPICHRSKSDRCRVVKWEQIDSIESSSPKTMIFKLNSTNEVDNIIMSGAICFCPHNSLMANVNNKSLKQLHFELLLEEDLNAVITSGLHFQLITEKCINHLVHDPICSSSNHNNNNNNNNNKDNDDNKRKAQNRNIFARLNRMIYWLHRHTLSHIVNRIQFKI